MAGFSVVWLDSATKTRRRATRADMSAVRELASSLKESGHGDIRYRPAGEPKASWRAVRPKAVTKPRRRKREAPFPPSAKAQKAKVKPDNKKGSDLLDRRLPGSYGMGKRR